MQLKSQNFKKEKGIFVISNVYIMKRSITEYGIRVYVLFLFENFIWLKCRRNKNDPSFSDAKND